MDLSSNFGVDRVGGVLWGDFLLLFKNGKEGRENQGCCFQHSTHGVEVHERECHLFGVLFGEICFSNNRC